MKNYNDKEGMKTEEILPNELKITILAEESEWYTNNVLLPMQEERAQRKQNFDREEKIAQKMREIALRELEKEEQDGG